MKKLKKILTFALILPCLFMFSGCGELKTPTEAVQSVTSSAESVKTNGTTVSDTEGPTTSSLQNSMTYTFSIPSFEGFTELTQKVAEKGASLSTATLALSGSLATLGVNILEITTNANEFYQVAESITVSEEDFNTLKEYAVELEKIAEEVEAFATNIQSKSQNLQETVNTIITKISGGTFAISDLDPMVTVFDDVIEIVNDADEKVVRVNEILAGVNSLLETFIAQ